MPKPPLQTRRPAWLSENLEKIFVQAQGQWIPKNPLLLRSALWAILYRMEQSSKKGARAAQSLKKLLNLAIIVENHVVSPSFEDMRNIGRSLRELILLEVHSSRPAHLLGEFQERQSLALVTVFRRRAWPWLH